MTAIEGTINGVPFQAELEPEGQKSHWLKVDRKLREAAGADAGDIVTLEVAPAAKDPEPGGTGRPEKSSRRRRLEGAGNVVGHHAQRAPGLDPLDQLGQASGDARAPDQKCLLDARGREATRGARPVRVLRQKHERSESGEFRCQYQGFTSLAHTAAQT